MPIRSAGAAFVDAFRTGRGLRQRDRALSLDERRQRFYEDREEYQRQRDARGDRMQGAAAAAGQQQLDFANALRLQKEQREQEKHQREMRQQSGPAGVDISKAPIQPFNERHFASAPSPDHFLVPESQIPGVSFERPHAMAMLNPTYEEAHASLKPDKRAQQEAILGALERQNKVEAEKRATLALRSELERGGVLDRQESEQVTAMLSEAQDSSDVLRVYDMLEQAKQAHVEHKQRERGRTEALAAVRGALGDNLVLDDESEVFLARLESDPTITPDEVRLGAGQAIAENNPYVKEFFQRFLMEKIIPDMTDMMVLSSIPMPSGRGKAQGHPFSKRSVEDPSKKRGRNERILSKLRKIEEDPKLSEAEREKRQRDYLRRMGLDYSAETFQHLAEEEGG